jgi:predicted DNA-binding mobile mystery protein A
MTSTNQNNNLKLELMSKKTTYRFMKKLNLQPIRLRQLEDQLSAERPIVGLERPSAGWLRAIRQALGLSLKSVAVRLGQSPQAVSQAEESEAAGTISLKRLEAAADAMGCRLVYAIVPKKGSLSTLAGAAENKALDAVQRTMALEGQEVENPGEFS